MGWWSESIMGGDSPLDYAGEIAHAVGAPQDFDATPDDSFHGWVFGPDAREKFQKDLVGFLKREMRYDKSVWVQVVGTIALYLGVPLSAGQKRYIIAWAERDEWLLDDGRLSARGRAIADFVARVKGHQGEKTRVPYTGLFDRMAESLGL